MVGIADLLERQYSLQAETRLPGFKLPLLSCVILGK